MRAQPDPFVGVVLDGRYTIASFLCEGRTAAIYVGEQMVGPNKRRVAVKTLRDHVASDPVFRELLATEARTLVSLDHPNTVQVLDFGATPGGDPFMVMELVEGHVLSQIIRREGSLPADRTANIVAQIGGSLAEAHANDCIHQDLEPAKITLSEGATQKDVVRVLGHGARGIADVGALPYMTEEQFSGRPLDARSNVYSLAVMAYQMLTGTLPFDAVSPSEWARQRETAAPRPIDGAPHGASVPAPMRDAIMRALAKSPDERWLTITDFVDRFTAHG